MKRLILCLALLALAALAVSLTGCGGGGGTSTTIYAQFNDADGQIDGLFYYDRYECWARKDGIATIRMTSNEVEPYLEVYFAGGDLIATSDVDPDNPDEAFIRFRVDEGEHFAVWAISNIANDRGSYRITFSSELEDIDEVEINALGAGKEKPKPAESAERFRKPQPTQNLR